MDGIGASLEATHDGTIQYEVINNEVKFSVLEGTGIFMPNFKYRLLIPQDNFIEIQTLKKTSVSFAKNWYKSVLNKSDQVHIIIHYKHKTHLPIPMQYSFKIIYSTLESLAMTRCVSSEKNQNLTYLENLLL